MFTTIPAAERYPGMTTLQQHGRTFKSVGVGNHVCSALMAHALAIEAASADETGTGSAEGESAVPKANAQRLAA